jgi:subtilisin family serine protease
MYFPAHSVLCGAQADQEEVMKPLISASPACLVPWAASIMLAACGGGGESSVDVGVAGQPQQTARALSSAVHTANDGGGEQDKRGTVDPSTCSESSGETMNPSQRAALTAAFAVTLAACGGGGDATDPAPAPPPAADPGPNVGVAGEVVVQLNTGADVTALAAAYELTVVDQFGKRPIWRLRTPAGTNADGAIASLRADARVRFAEPNAENETPEGRKRSAWAVGGDAGSYATQWVPASLRLPEAHVMSVGRGIRVAVLDTGLDLTHPAFAGRLALDGAGALLGRDFVDDDANPSEVGSGTDLGYGHGTHVAGLVSLVAPAATLMPARVLDRQGRGNVWVLSEALLWAADPDANPASDDGAHVINLSLGTTQQTNLLRTAVALANCDFDDDDDEFEDAGFDDDRARCANKFGAVVLAAAGNDGSATISQYPAAEAVPGSLSVTAYTEQRTLAPFANRGTWVEIAAPGERIISTFPGGGYATWSGTSMATPLAAGTAALVLAAYADPRSVLPLDITQRLLARAAPLCATPLRALDAAAAATDTQAPEPPCP